jgi:hypothetical protein
LANRSRDDIRLDFAEAVDKGSAAHVTISDLSNYYLRLVRRFPQTFRENLETWQFWSGIALVAVIYFVPTLNEWVVPSWVLWVGLAALILWVLARANYDVAQDTAVERADLKAQVTLLILTSTQTLGSQLRHRMQYEWTDALVQEQQTWMQDLQRYLHDNAPSHSGTLFVPLPGVQPTYAGSPVRSQALSRMDAWLIRLQEIIMTLRK